MRREKTSYIPCHHVKIGDDEWVHIPGCHGSIHNPAHCTCYPTGSELEEAIGRRDEAERYIERLHEKAGERAERLNDMFHRNRKLNDEIRRLETVLAAATS